MDLLLVVVILTAAGAWQTRNHRTGPAPDFALPTLTGGAVDKASLQGKPTLVVFWAPWCGVCRAESPNISRVQELVGARANVISVVSDYDGTASIQRFVDDRGVDYPVLLGGTRTAREWGVRAFPSIFFLDEEGQITGSVVGYSTTLGLLWRLLV